MENVKFPIETRYFSLQPTDEKNLWSKEWVVTLKDGGNAGKLDFDDSIFHGEIQLRVELHPDFDKSKFYEDIFFMMSRFIFRFQDLNEISTVCDDEAEQVINGLEKAGFVRRELKDGEYYYSMKRQKTSWVGVYIIIGMIAGFMVGILIENLWIGTISSVIVGALVGFTMDHRIKK